MCRQSLVRVGRMRECLGARQRSMTAARQVSVIVEQGICKSAAGLRVVMWEQVVHLCGRVDDYACAFYVAALQHCYCLCDAALQRGMTHLFAGLGCSPSGGLRSADLLPRLAAAAAAANLGCCSLAMNRLGSSSSRSLLIACESDLLCPTQHGACAFFLRSLCCRARLLACGQSVRLADCRSSQAKQ